MSNQRVCPVCGYQLLDNEDTCIICGKKFDSPQSVYSQNESQSYGQPTPNQSYQSSTTRTYHSGNVQSHNTQNEPDRTDTYRNQTLKEFKKSVEKKKMPVVLKVFLIFFAIQFLAPIIMGIGVAIFALFTIGNMEERMNSLLNANVDTIEIQEIDIDEDEYTDILTLDSGNNAIFISKDDVVQITLSDYSDDYNITIYVDYENWEDVYSNTSSFSAYHNNGSVGIDLYAPSMEYENELETIHMDAMDNIERLEDIEFGTETFHTYKCDYAYVFVTELKSGYYLTCRVSQYDEQSRTLEEIFPLKALNKY